VQQIDGVPFLLKSGAHERGDLTIVLDDKDTHVPGPWLTWRGLEDPALISMNR
jgi:hypothetical protein